MRPPLLSTCLCTTIGETFADNLTTSWAGGDLPHPSVEPRLAQDEA